MYVELWNGIIIFSLVFSVTVISRVEDEVVSLDYIVRGKLLIYKRNDNTYIGIYIVLSWIFA